MSNQTKFNGGPVKDYHVFSRGKYVGTLDSVLLDLYAGEQTKMTNEMYQKAFIYHKEAKPGQHQWWRADGTPYPKEQVPKDYLIMSLLVT